MQVALLDWDNTIHRGYTIYSLANFLLEHELVSVTLIQRFKELETQYLHKNINYAEYTERTCESFAQALAGRSYKAYKDAIAAYRPISESALFEYAYPLFELLNKYSIQTYLISGAPFDVLETYAEPFNLKGIFAFQLETQGDVLTGRVACNYGLNKERMLNHPILLSPNVVHLLSMGDAVADIPLLDNSLIPIVAGDQPLALKSSSLSLTFTAQHWDLSLLEERIKAWAEQPHQS